nr:long chain acyl-CoA synthetase 4-like [Tanacetum cinerariifolium]
MKILILLQQTITSAILLMQQRNVLLPFVDANGFNKNEVAFRLVTAIKERIRISYLENVSSNQLISQPYNGQEASTRPYNLETSDSFDLPSKMRSDICTIIGITGETKGVIITNESILSILSGVHHHLESMSEEFQVSDVFFSYLPLAHVFGRVIEELFISNGASIGIWRGDIKLLIDDLKELKPTVFCVVPRVLDRIYS